MRTHTRNKLYVCELCEKKLVSQANSFEIKGGIQERRLEILSFVIKEVSL
jgi:hypothetical protein